MGNCMTLPVKRPLEYLDFELEISHGSGQEYPVALLHSPAGEARETMHFPFSNQELEEHLHALEKALLSSGKKPWRKPTREQQSVQSFGQALFDALLVGEVRSCYNVSQGKAREQGKGLRLKLRIQAPELAALPWEFMYDPRQGGHHLCLSRYTLLVRYLEVPQPVSPLNVTTPLRILGMAVSPSDLDQLDLAREQQRMEKAVQELEAKGLVRLTWLAGQTWRDLHQAMQEGPWHVFHFIGHGWFDRKDEEGFVVLADESANAHHLSATELGLLLADHRSLQLVLLNACEGARGDEHDVFSSTAAILVRLGIPAVLAMQYPITDEAAIEFAGSFYRTLANGDPVEAAVSEARKAVSLGVKGTVEWGIPVLHMRSLDGTLFHIQDRLGESEEPIDDVRRRALLYEQGKELEVDDPRGAYSILHDLYEEDPSYRDVTALCADIAFKIGTCRDDSIGWEQRVEWLEKAVGIVPDYEEGHAQELLDDFRHRWAEEILDDDRSTAVTQLEKISPGYTQWQEVYQKLVDVYFRLLAEGIQIRTEQPNTEAEAEARYRLGIQRWGKGDLSGAVDQLTEISTKAQEFQSAQFALVQIYRALGAKSYREERLQNALEWHEKALTMARALREGLSVQGVELALAQVYRVLGDDERRKKHLENALAWYMKAQGLEKSAKIGVTVQEVDVALRTALPPEESTWLRKRLIQYFDEEELRTLCSDLRVDYDSLQGKGKEAKARELVAYLGRRGRIHALIEMCIRLRPHVDWEETTHIPPPERSQIGD